MKKLLLVALLAIGFVFALPASSFAVNPHVSIVGGVVRSNGSNLKDADVTVTCNGHSLTDTTNGAGKYVVKFDAADCPAGSVVTASATKGNESGSSTGTADPLEGTDLNIAVVNVDVSVPEMGTVVGGIAALGAGGAFLMVRRKQQGIGQA